MKEDPIYASKLDNLLKQNDMKQDVINQKLKELKEIRLICDKELKILRKHFESLCDSKYLPLKESITAITYLVSKIEDCSYEMQMIPAYLDINNKKVKFNIAYLVQSKEKDNVYKYFMQMLKTANIKDFLMTPNDNYLIMAYYKSDDGNVISYEEDNIYYLTHRNEKLLTSKIFDKRFNYIFDYTDFLINYRLDKENLEISLDEMIMLADKFISIYQKSNTKQLRKKA